MLTPLRRALNKPQYLLRPSQLLRRLFRIARRQSPGETEEAVLAWGLPIRFHPRETIGSNIWRLGLYDLCVCETLFRLINPGELAVDVGANIGQMTGLMALRAGKVGRVIAFEPHPELFRELSANVERWRDHARIASMALHPIALSDRCGTGQLRVTD